MGGELIGLVAVILGMGVPLGALSTYFRVRKLRSEERLAAIARGVDIPMEPELNQAARSRSAGILLVSGAIGYIVTFGLIASIQAESDDVADGSADQQDSGAAGTRRLVQFRFHRNINSAGNGREPLFAAQLAHPEIGRQRAEGNSHPQNHGH